jgi:hypothetical protein
MTFSEALAQGIVNGQYYIFWGFMVFSGISVAWLFILLALDKAKS